MKHYEFRVIFVGYGSDVNEALEDAIDAARIEELTVEDVECRLVDDDSKVSLSDEELGTVLAALRFYQEKGQDNPGNRSSHIHDIATDIGRVTSLDKEAIDQLCERLNSKREL